MTNPPPNRIEELKRQIEDLKKRWPRHSVPPHMMEQLDELETELQAEVEKQSAAQPPVENGAG